MKIKDIYYDTDHIQGCPTCDYGSSYITDFTIIYEDEHKLSFIISGDNGKLISEGDLMCILANTSNEDEIKESIINKCKRKIRDSNNYYSGSLKINGEEVI